MRKRECKEYGEKGDCESVMQAILHFVQDKKEHELGTSKILHNLQDKITNWAGLTISAKNHAPFTRYPFDDDYSPCNLADFT